MPHAVLAKNIPKIPLLYYIKTSKRHEKHTTGKGFHQSNFSMIQLIFELKFTAKYLHILHVLISKISLPKIKKKKHSYTAMPIFTMVT